MDEETLEFMIENQQSIEKAILLNGKFDVGTVEIYPHKFISAISELYALGDINIFDSESDLKKALEKMREKEPSDDELDTIRNYHKEKGNEEIPVGELKRDVKNYFLNSNEDALKNRLNQQVSRIVLVAMMKNFDGLMTNALLLALSITQAQTEDKVREDLGLRKLKAHELREFILSPSNELIDFLLKITKGGNRKKKNGFSFTEENKKKFAKKVNSQLNIKIPKKKKSYSLWDLVYQKIKAEGRESLPEILKDRKYADLPKDLLDEALDSWVKNESSSKKLSDKYKPKMYLYRQVLRELGFSGEFKFSTLDKRYREGKRLMNK